jgi:hypothetical protein
VNGCQIYINEYAGLLFNRGERVRIVQALDAQPGFQNRVVPDPEGLWEIKTWQNDELWGGRVVVIELCSGQ